MSTLKKSFRFFIAALLVAAFALTVTACSKEDKKTTYAVSFVTYCDTQIDPQYVEEGKTATKPDAIEREGFTFVNWYADDACETVYDFATPVTAPITIYAKWQAKTPEEQKPSDTENPPKPSDTEDPNPSVPEDKKVTLTLDYNYDNKTEQIKILKGTTIPKDKQAPTRDGFYFEGWYTDKACTLANLHSLSASIDKDTTLYANWSQDPVQEPDGKGIDFSKMPSSASGNVSGSDNFTFNETVNIGSVTAPVEPVQPSGNDEQYTVTFNPNGGTAVSSQSVAANGKAVLPSTPEKDGNMFCGWYTDSGLNNAYDFDTAVTTPLTLYAKWSTIDSRVKSVNSYNESLAVVFTESNPANASVQYSVKGENDWKSVDSLLIRKEDNSTARVDIIGLPAGEYNVKITPSSGSEITLPEAVAVSAYDRSGYAHFNRASSEAAYGGVGAYNDDGSLKDGALVIYVTDANKNNVKEYVYKNTANGLVKEDISAYIKTGKPQQNGRDLGGDSYWSIGYILNNRGYENNTERANYGIQKLTFTYSAVVVRLLGTIACETNYSTGAPSIHGLTYYAKAGQTNPITDETYKKGVAVPNGGTVNDDGAMARITNAKNLTIEGIGEDTVMEGWGIHFVSNDNLHTHQGAGTSFEVRNVTFKNYPEDAIGMEGTQGKKVDSTGSITSGASDADADLKSPVERCWVHHNTFLPGYCEKPAESDKADGDGSCDFKRGQFYTLSYNHFSNCHKTNLIGSSDTTQTFNVTIHHNWYETVKARQPLARRANIHYYNNYVSDATDYVTSFRGSCLVFSEANYYDGCKQVTQKKDGVGVAWNNIYNSCYNENDYIELKSRTETVPNDCKFIYRNIDYTQFYINSEQFYYDSVNKVSDCLLDDAVGARIRVLMQAGANGSQIDAQSTAYNQYTPSSAVNVGSSGLSINFKDTSKISKGSSVVSNVVLNGITGVDSKTGIKGKGQIITFTITAPTEVKVEGTASGEDLYPQIFDSYGKAWQTKFNGEVTVVLPAGTYVVATGQKDKEATISSISFADTEASSVARVNAAQVALAAVPEEIGYNSYSLIKAAKDAYSALLSNEIEQIDGDLVARLRQAEAAYESLAVKRVIARINYIGEVDETSYNKISAARKEYNALNAEQQKQVTNLATLTQAETTFAQFAAKNVSDLIKDLPDLTQATISTEETLTKVENWFDTVNRAYEDLTEDQQKQVTGYEKVAAGYAELKKFATMIEFRATLAETEVEGLTTGQGAALTNLYKSLTEAQKATLLAAERNKYEAIMVVYTELANQTKSLAFDKKEPITQDGDFWKYEGKFKDGTSSTINNVTYSNGLKLDSNGKVQFTTSSKMTLKVYYANKSRIKLDGVTDVTGEAEGDHYVATIEIEAGEHTISKGKDGESYLYMVELSPAN